MLNKITKMALGLFLATILNTQAQVEFITIWDLSLPGTTIPGNLTFDVSTSGPVTYTWETFPISSLSGTGSFTGTVFAASNLPAGEKIKLKINFMNFNSIIIDNGIDRKRLIDISHWGKVNWTSMNSAFRGCENLSGVGADDVPYLGSLFDMSYMFSGAALFNQTIGGWGTNSVKDMSNMFFRASSFNQDISGWNTSNVLAMSNMFNGASAYNKPLNTWDVSSVTNMGSMFRSAISFNMPLSNWNTSNVTNMVRMFYGASAFNQPINNWNVSNVIAMNGMFDGAILFNQFVGGWNISNAIGMATMFANATAFNQNIGAWGVNLNTNVNLMDFLNNSGMNGANYDALLMGINSGTVLGITMGATNIYYCNAVAEHLNLITVKGWTLMDGGQANVTTIIGQPMSSTVCGTTLPNFVVSAVGSNLMYTWSNGLSMNQSMMTSVPGAYFVTVTGACGSPQVSGANNLTVLPLTAIITQPLASATVCSGIAQTYMVSATGANLSYAWSNGLSSNNSMATSVAGTNYAVSIVGTCGTVISNSVSLNVINCTQTSIDSELQPVQYQIFPNPSDGKFYIDAIGDSKEIYTITSVDGRVILRGMLSKGKNDIEAALTKGIYFIKVGSEVKKLLIE